MKLKQSFCVLKCRVLVVDQNKYANAFFKIQWLASIALLVLA